MTLPPHRQLVAHLELALESLDEAITLDGFLPHWAQGQIRQMGEDLSDLLERIGHEVPALAADDWGDEP
jgi:hypothetical protein